METQMRYKKHWILLLCILSVIADGCSHSNAPPPNPVTQSQQAQPPSAGPAPAYGPSAAPSAYGPSAAPPAAPPSTSRPVTKLLEFNDVPIPSEVNVQPKNSYVFQSGHIKAGFLTLRGRVDSNSLVNFFETALPREGWRLKAQFRANRSLLIFDKPDKICVI